METKSRRYLHSRTGPTNTLHVCHLPLLWKRPRDSMSARSLLVCGCCTTFRAHTSTLLRSSARVLIGAEYILLTTLIHTHTTAGGTHSPSAIPCSFPSALLFPSIWLHPLLLANWPCIGADK